MAIEELFLRDPNRYIMLACDVWLSPSLPSSPVPAEGEELPWPGSAPTLPAATVSLARVGMLSASSKGRRFPLKVREATWQT